MSRQINAWFSIGSTYTYLAVMRLRRVAREAGVEVAWRPFSVRRIMIEQNNAPFRDKPVKTAYMWRDIERRARMRGLSPVLPAPYPLREFDFANQVAVVAAEEGWCEAYAREAYRLWFELGREPGVEPFVDEALTAVGQAPARVKALAASSRILDAYGAATDQARSLGIFGSPTFEVGGEIFWGDDRLEDALAWVETGTPAPSRPG